jgi:hypothetical protein
MRQGHNKRMRGRNRKGPNPLSRSFESNGPDVKIRGTAAHVAEKYVALARDAASAGDRVAEQNYLQHAEHYFRIVAAAQAQMPQQQQPQNQRSDYDDDEGDEMYDRRPMNHDGRPAVGLADPQPYVNGSDSGGNAEPNGHGGQREAGAPGDTSGGNGDAQAASRNRRPQRERPARPESGISVDDDSASGPSED